VHRDTVQSQNDSCRCTEKCFNLCVNWASISMTKLKEIEKVCASSKKEFSPWALKMCTQHNCNCLKPILLYAIETVIIGKRACWRLYCHCWDEIVHEACLSIEIVSLNVGSDLSLPLISIVEELLLIIKQFFVSLCGELKVGALKRQRSRGKH